MNTQRTARRRARGTIAVLLCISLAAAACSDDTNNASGRTRNAALVGLINGTFTADQGGWVGAGFPLGTWGQCAGGLPSLGDPANALTFGTSAAAVTQSVTIPSPSTVTMSASARVGGNVANTYTFTMADNNEAPSTGALTGMSYTSPTASTLSVTTTAANENVTITIAAVTATSSLTGCIGPVVSDASLAIAVTSPATTTTATATATATTTTTIATVSATTTTIAPVVRAECLPRNPCIVGSVDSKGNTVTFYGPAHLIYGASAFDWKGNEATIAVQTAPTNWNGGTAGDPVRNWNDAAALAGGYGAAGDGWHLPYPGEPLYPCRLATLANCAAPIDAKLLPAGLGDAYWTNQIGTSRTIAQANLLSSVNNTGVNYDVAGLFSLWSWQVTLKDVTNSSTPWDNWWVNPTVGLSVRPVRELTIMPLPDIGPAPTTTAVPSKVYTLGGAGQDSGKVFFVNTSAAVGYQYLEAWTRNLGPGDWTSSIFQQRWGGTDPWYSHDRAVTIYVADYKADWRLPTTAELRIMYAAQGTAGDVSMDPTCYGYWSSDIPSASIGGLRLNMAFAVNPAGGVSLWPNVTMLCVRFIRNF